MTFNELVLLFVKGHVTQVACTGGGTFYYNDRYETISKRRSEQAVDIPMALGPDCQVAVYRWHVLRDQNRAVVSKIKR